MADNPRTKVYKASGESKASVEINEESIVLAGNKDNLVVADQAGITIKGPISFVTDAMGIRRGGLFVGINDFMHMIPSTLISPIPNQIPFPPIHGLVNLQKDLAFFLSLLC